MPLMFLAATSPCLRLRITTLRLSPLNPQPGSKSTPVLNYTLMPTSSTTLYVKTEFGVWGLRFGVWGLASGGDADSLKHPPPHATSILLHMWQVVGMQTASPAMYQ
jgi:hypothetical protein